MKDIIAPIPIPEGAIRVFKFVTEEYLSPMRNVYAPVDYSGPYPKVVTPVNGEVDPPEDGQCAKGIHVIPMIDKINWLNVTFDPKFVAGYVMPEDVIFSEDNGKMRVRKFVVTHEPPREEIIPFILQDPEASLKFAAQVDKAPSDDTRAAVCQASEEFAYEYMIVLDKKARKDTWNAVQSNTIVRAWYANFLDIASRKLDEQFREETCDQPTSSP